MSYFILNWAIKRNQQKVLFEIDRKHMITYAENTTEYDTVFPFTQSCKLVRW